MKIRLVNISHLSGLALSALVLSVRADDPGVFSPDVNINPTLGQGAKLFINGPTEDTGLSLAYWVEGGSYPIGEFGIDAPLFDASGIYWQWRANQEYYPMYLSATGELGLSGADSGGWGNMAFVGSTGHVYVYRTDTSYHSGSIILAAYDGHMDLNSASGGRIVMDAKDGFIKINNQPVAIQSASGLNLAANGSVGIGVSSPASKLDVYSVLPTTNWASGVLFNAYDSNGTNGVNHVGTHALNQWAPSNDAYDAGYTGLQSSVYLTGAANVSSTAMGTVKGTVTGLGIMGSGYVGSAVSYTGKTWLDGSSHIEHSINYLANAPVKTGTGTIANSYGLFLEPQKQAFVTNGFGVYQQGYNDKNYFAGSVGLGTDLITQKLVVGGNTATLGDGAGFLAINRGDGSYTGNFEMIRLMPINDVYYLQTLAGGTGVDRDLKIGAGPAGLYLKASSGNIGVGTTAPAEKLHVSGNAKLEGDVNVTGVLKIREQGDLSMGDFTAGAAP